MLSKFPDGLWEYTADGLRGGGFHSANHLAIPLFHL